MKSMPDIFFINYNIKQRSLENDKLFWGGGGVGPGMLYNQLYEAHVC